MTHASAKRCSCRSAVCSIPTRWPPTRLLRCVGRAAARDLVDVAALSGRYPLEQLCDLAAEKDAGFDRRVFADALSAAAAHSDAAFAELGLEPETVAALRAGAARWRSQLLDAADVPATDAAHPSADRRCQSRRLLTISIRCEHLNVIGRRLPTPVETAHRGSAESAEIIGSRCAGLGVCRSIGSTWFRLCYFRLSRPDTSWCTTRSHAGEGSRERLRNLRNVMRTSWPSQRGRSRSDTSVE